MSRPPERYLGRGLLAGTIASAALILVSLLLRVWLGIPLVAELASDRIIPLLSIRQFGQLARLMGGLERAKEITLIGGFALEFLIGVGAGAVLARIIRRHPGSGRRRAAVVAAPLGLAWVGSVAGLWPVLDSSYIGLPPDTARVMTGIGLAALFVAYGLAFGFALGPMTPHPSGAGQTPHRGVERRRILLAGAGAIGMAAAGTLVGWLYGRATVGPNGYDGLRTLGPEVEPITPNDRFYVVTKNLVDPAVRSGLWRLEVRGMVDHARTYTYGQIRALPATDQLQTLECISNGVGGGLMSNAAWRGVPLPELLRAAAPQPGARDVVAHAADGYVHVLPLAKAMEPTTLLAYLMNGVPLPDRHGYPVRLLVPGAFGEVSVKWIDRIELVPGGVEGYYEQQGWRPFAVPTTSRFDRPRSQSTLPLAASPIALGGVAFAGDRGISSVEFSADAERPGRPPGSTITRPRSPGRSGAASGGPRHPVGTDWRFGPPTGPAGSRTPGAGERRRAGRRASTRSWSTSRSDVVRRTARSPGARPWRTPSSPRRTTPPF